MMNNIRLKNFWALGFVEEVMNGAVYKPSGVCPHQCWSETNILHPGINGMVGWQPDAPHNTAVLEPRFPLNWDHSAVKNLRVGKTRMDFTMDRSNQETVYTLALNDGPPVKIDFVPQFPLGMRPLNIIVDGQEIDFSNQPSSEQIRAAISINVSKKVILKIRHKGGIGVVPYIPEPSPEDSSEGYKIIRESLKGSEYTLLLEGKTGGEVTLELMMFGQEYSEIMGAELVYRAPNLDKLIVDVKFPDDEKPFSKQMVTVMLK
jgi:hypothetical protein